MLPAGTSLQQPPPQPEYYNCNFPAYRFHASPPPWDNSTHKSGIPQLEQCHSYTKPSKFRHTRLIEDLVRYNASVESKRKGTDSLLYEQSAGTQQSDKKEASRVPEESNQIKQAVTEPEPKGKNRQRNLFYCVLNRNAVSSIFHHLWQS